MTSHQKPLLVFFTIIIITGMVLEPVSAKKRVKDPTYDEVVMMQNTAEELLAGDPWVGMVSSDYLPVAYHNRSQDDEVDMALIEAELNAVKAQKAQVATECRAARQAHASDKCFVLKLNAICDKKQAELKVSEDALRLIWGDRRKGTTRFFGRVNAFRRRVWRGMGTSGRRIIRNLGEDVLDMVMSGQPVSGGVIGVVLRRHVRKEVKAYAFRRIVDKISGNIDVGIECDEKLTDSQKTKLPAILRQEETKEPSPETTETEEEEFTDFAGRWYGGGVCGEGESPAFRWNVELIQDSSGWVTGMISFHACPGGGAVFYNVYGQATAEKVISLTGEKSGGRGDLGAGANNYIEFSVRYKKAPKPNLTQ